MYVHVCTLFYLKICIYIIISSVSWKMIPHAPTQVIGKPSGDRP